MQLNSLKNLETAASEKLIGSFLNLLGTKLTTNDINHITMNINPSSCAAFLVPCLNASCSLQGLGLHDF